MKVNLQAFQTKQIFKGSGLYDINAIIQQLPAINNKRAVALYHWYNRV